MPFLTVSCNLSYKGVSEGSRDVSIIYFKQLRRVSIMNKNERYLRKCGKTSKSVSIIYSIFKS